MSLHETILRLVMDSPDGLSSKDIAEALFSHPRPETVDKVEFQCNEIGPIIKGMGGRWYYVSDEDIRSIRQSLGLRV